jgi:cytochrome c5
MQKMIILPILALTLNLTACGEKQANTPTSENNKPAAQSTETDKPMEIKTAEADMTQTPTDSNHPGKLIHDKHCMNCHDSGVYTRPDHKMKDYSMLSGQVRGCDANIGSKLSDEDMNKIADYLNEMYYKFPKP